MKKTARTDSNEFIQVLTISGEAGDTYSMPITGDGSGHYESQDHISLFISGEQNISYTSTAVGPEKFNSVAPSYGGSVIYDAGNKWSYPEGEVHYEVVEDCVNVFIYPSSDRRNSDEEIAFEYEIVAAGSVATSPVDGWIIPLEGEHELTIHAVPAGEEISPVVLSVVVWEV